MYWYVVSDSHVLLIASVLLPGRNSVLPLQFNEHSCNNRATNMEASIIGDCTGVKKPNNYIGPENTRLWDGDWRLQLHIGRKRNALLGKRDCLRSCQQGPLACWSSSPPRAHSLLFLRSRSALWAEF